MKGIFWIIEDELRAYVFEEGAEYGVAKAGDTYNHKLFWKQVVHDNRHAFDYYPRGRVEHKKDGTAIVYMSPHIGEEYIPRIMEAFGLMERPRINYDRSEHYRCYLDRN